MSGTDLPYIRVVPLIWFFNLHFKTQESTGGMHHGRITYVHFANKNFFRIPRQIMSVYEQLGKFDLDAWREMFRGFLSEEDRFAGEISTRILYYSFKRFSISICNIGRLFITIDQSISSETE